MSLVLAVHTLTPIPDQVAFRLDFSTWLQLLNRRDRRLAEFLAVGNLPSEAAQYFGMSRARVSQLRDELQSNWEESQGDATERQA